MNLKLIQGVGNFITPLICCILESVSLIKVTSQHDSICIQAREVSSETYIFLSLVSMLIVPDLIISLISVLDFKSIDRASGTIYHAIAAFICFCASFVFYKGLTFCGNAAQDKFYCALILATIAGIIHFLNIFFVLMQMPKNSKWAIPSPFNKGL